MRRAQQVLSKCNVENVSKQPGTFPHSVKRVADGESRPKQNENKRTMRSGRIRHQTGIETVEKLKICTNYQNFKNKDHLR